MIENTFERCIAAKFAEHKGQLPPAVCTIKGKTLELNRYGSPLRNPDCPFSDMTTPNCGRASNYDKDRIDTYKRNTTTKLGYRNLRSKTRQALP